MTESPLNVPRLLKEHELTPNKALGQNFLVDPYALEKVIKAGNVTQSDTVLEIGAGLGSLTRLLATHARQVVAVEIDRQLLPVLEEVLRGYQNVKLIQADMLSLDPAELIKQQDYLVIANIPYYITSYLIRHLLSSSLRPRRLVLTIQKEVAERICARDGKMSLLSLSVQLYGQPKIAASIPAGCFYPAPKIDSSVLAVNIYPEPIIPYPLIESFFTLAHAGFGMKRKTLRNALSNRLGLSTEQVSATLVAAGIDPQRRAETLSLQEWKELTLVFNSY